MENKFKKQQTIYLHEDEKRTTKHRRTQKRARHKQENETAGKMNCERKQQNQTCNNIDKKQHETTGEWEIHENKINSDINNKKKRET